MVSDRSRQGRVLEDPAEGGGEDLDLNAVGGLSQGITKMEKLVPGAGIGINHRDYQGKGGR